MAKISSTKRPVTRYECRSGGNRELPKIERASFDLAPMTVAEFNASRLPFLAGMTEGSEEERRAAATKFRDAVLGERVRAVYVLEGDSGPVTPETLVASSVAANDADWAGLPDELYSAITKASVLAEGVAGN